ncbi:MAG: hypothetical protein IBJ16_00715 [Chitinophagaceae bacterium]|nr:hypothetical protein [Chitinophagaceae bacterium]
MDFKEEQSLSKTKASLLVLLPFLAPLVLYIIGLPINTVITSLIIVSVICIVSWLFLKTIKLQLCVNETGISLRIKGLQGKEEMFLWKDIERIQKVSVKPLKEFGGWGLRYSRSRTGYIFGGEKGVELFTNRKSTIVITIRDTDSFFAAIAFFQPNL